MSFTSNEDKCNLPIALVEGGSSDGEVIYIEDEKTKKSKIIKKNNTTVVEVEDGCFQQLPNSNVRVIVIAGQSGSGKSTWAANYIKLYLKENKKSKFYVFSQLSEDPVIDELKPHRITLDESLIDDPIDVEEIEAGSMILFDDCSDCDGPLQKAINLLEKRILSHGRKRKIQIVITSHLVNPSEANVAKLRHVEMQCLVFFPNSGSTGQAEGVMKKHMGMSARQVNKALNIESRWISITRTYPSTLLSENFITFTKSL